MIDSCLSQDKESEMIRGGLKTCRKRAGARTRWRTKRFSSRSLLACILTYSICLSIFPASQNVLASHLVVRSPGQNNKGSLQPRQLSPGAPWQSAITGGDLHSYLITLDSDQYLRASVTQRGVNVVVTLYGPDGKKLIVADKQRMIEGKEIVSSIIETPGEYKLEVRSVSRKTRSGIYEIEIEALRKSTEEDRSRMAGEKLAEEAAGYITQWWLEGSIQSAIKKYEESLALFQLAKDRCAEINTLVQIGYLHIRQNQHTKALVCFERALALRQAAECVEESDLLAAIGGAYAGLGEDAKARLYFDQAVERNRTTGNRLKLSQIFHQMGSYYYWSNEPQKALHYFSEAMALALALENPRSEAGLLFGAGSVYWSIGENQKALEVYSKALSLWHTLGDQGWATTTLDNLGLVYEAMGEHEKALDCYAQTLAFRRTARQRSAEADTLTGMGKIYTAMDNPALALKHFDEALSIYEEVSNQMGVAYALRSTGAAYGSMREHHKALDYYKRALPIDRKLGDRGGEVKALAGIARAYRDLNNPAEARTNIESAIDLIESMRAKLTDEQLRAAYFASKRDSYEFYIDLLMRMHRRDSSEGHNKKAFEASERARARSLLDLLAEAGIDIRQKHFRYAETNYPSPLAVEEVQSLLDDQTAILEYTIGKESSFLFVISRSDIHSYELPQASEINRLVGEARLSLGQPGRRSVGRYVSAARQLYEMLVAPAAAVLSGKQRLLIAPDHSLYYLPFEILIDEMPKTHGRADYRMLPYMVKRWAISYIPSASVLSSLRSNRAATIGAEDMTERKEIVAFGDPVYVTTNTKLPATGDKLIRGLIDREKEGELLRLVDSGREVSAIAGYYRPEDVTLYLGKEASEENVKASHDLRNARRIHFAAHGFINERQPQHSGLALTLSGESKEDGLLQVYEILNLKLNAELVVLSACRTGLGKEVRGEGVMGLMRAFMYAGASSVVVSQWQVADRSTADLMVKFYKRMNDSNGKTEALQRAKIEMIESGLYSHPYYWAPFILIGEPN